ncbi:hypothetical protein OKW24_000925 [Peribacillus simplex]|jgi:hypothetical protein|nr:hypothetical protein [Peribacillus simplex]
MNDEVLFEEEESMKKRNAFEMPGPQKKGKA